MNTIYPVSDATMDEFLAYCTIEEYEKGKILCDFKEVCKKYFFILSGICRTYTLDSNGKEVNKSILGRNRSITSVNSVVFNRPSEFKLQVLEAGRIAYMNHEDYMMLIKKYSDMAIYHFKYTNFLLMRLENHVSNLLTKDATERFLELKNEIPNVEIRIQLKHIASYIGVTPIQLSRIRKKLLVENLVE